MPPFYSNISKVTLDEIKSKKKLREQILKEFDHLLLSKSDKATWFKYLSSMPGDSRDSKGSYRILKYCKAFPYTQLEPQTLVEALSIKDDSFIFQFLLHLPICSSDDMKSLIGQVIEKNKNLREKLFKCAKKERESFFTSCILAYRKSNKMKEDENKIKDLNYEIKLIEHAAQKEHVENKKIKVKTLFNAQTKNKESSSRVPFFEETEDLWNYLSDQSIKHKYTVYKEVLSRFSDVLSVDHQGSLVSVTRREQKEFIHANYVSLKNDRYILASYPSNQKIGNFLRSIIQSEVLYVIDFTQDCDIDELNKYYSFGCYDGVQVKVESIEKITKSGFSISEIECIDTESNFEKKHKFFHFRFKDWKAHQPIKIKKLQKLVEDIEKKAQKDKLKTPILIHSNKGTGRGAVFLATLHLYKEIKKNKKAQQVDSLKHLASDLWSLRVQAGPNVVESFMYLNILVRYLIQTLR